MNSIHSLIVINCFFLGIYRMPNSLELEKQVTFALIFRKLIVIKRGELRLYE
jgi:hypothetical protein